MAQYTAITDVSNELNGFSITSTSTPSIITVKDWITESDSQTNLMTGRVWSSETASSETYDYDGSGSIFTKYAPIISVTEVLVETAGIDAAASVWSERTEGRTNANDFMLYKNDGELVFHGTQKPNAGFQNLMITYTYGYASVPSYIKRLSTLLTARRIIEAIQSGSATEEGGTVSVGTISVSDPSQFGNNRLKQIDDEVKSILRDIGSFKTYRFTRRYD